MQLSEHICNFRAVQTTRTRDQETDIFDVWLLMRLIWIETRAQQGDSSLKGDASKMPNKNVFERKINNFNYKDAKPWQQAGTIRQKHNSKNSKKWRVNNIRTCV